MIGSGLKPPSVDGGVPEPRYGVPAAVGGTAYPGRVPVHLHRAERTDRLATGLADLLAAVPDDPFATELVLVPAPGVERWLSQRLSHHLGAASADDGICAGVEFRSPGSLISELLGTREADPWSGDALAWPMLATLDDVLDQPWAATLARHLGHSDTGPDAELRRGRRYAVARRLAAHFAAYAGQRPSVLVDWSEDRDTDGAGDPIPPDLAWQPPLWRELVTRVAAPTPAERHAAVLDRLERDPASFALPPRLSLFGHTRLAASEIDLLAGLGRHREVHLWLPHPSPRLWAELAAGLTHGGGPVRRRSDDSAQLVGHPLLASLGRDLRELQRSFVPLQATDDTIGTPVAHPQSLLGWLQADLTADALPDEAVRLSRRHDRADRSLQVHAAHGAARQVEVLREVLLGLLADDPDLQPRDILVMCPDIERYAPLISAAFGLGEVVGAGGHPAHQLRVRLADRSLSQTNPLLGIAGSLLELAGGRATVSEVLDLAHSGPVRRRFGFSDDDLEQVSTWVTEAGVRWAFDAAHRADYGLAGYVQNTWRFGLDRILLGVTMSDDSEAWVDRTLPLDDVGSSEIDLAGRFAEYVDRLAAVTDRLSGERPLSEWLHTLDDGVLALTDVAASDAWQPAHLHRVLTEIEDLSTAQTAPVPAADPAGAGRLRLPDVRAVLEHHLRGRPTRANFRTGTLTVCTMTPMRSVPHKVVCLLGVDDGVFPRSGVSDGDDLLARDPLTGERDVRSEDRQLMLDALLAATDTLVITYTGADPLTGATRPPAVPLGELLDAVDLTATTADGGSLREAVTVRHPLQPFDLRNVTTEALGRPEPFSFDRAALAGARAARQPRTPAAPFLAGPLPALPPDDIALDDLLAFYKHPVQSFLRQRVAISTVQEAEEAATQIPVELGGLEQWQVATRLLDDILSGQHPDQAAQAEWRRGQLPPGRLGWRVLKDLETQVRPLAAAALDLRGSATARAVDIDIDLGDGRRLHGTVPEIFGDRLVPVSFSRLGPSHRLGSWIRLLALTASDDDHNWTAHTIGRPANSRSQQSVQISVMGPLDHTAREHLIDLVRIRDHGLCTPLPLPIKPSFHYAQLRRTDARAEDALREARLRWTSGTYAGDDREPANVRIWGAGAPLPGIPGEIIPELAVEGERHLFGSLAMRVWGPMLAAEQGSW